MDPIIFTIPGTSISLHWYGLIMAVGIILAGLVAEWGVRQRGENGEHVWELLIWAVPFGPGETDEITHSFLLSYSCSIARAYRIGLLSRSKSRK